MAILALVALVAALSQSAAAVFPCCPATSITYTALGSISGGCARYVAIKVPEPLPTGYTLDVRGGEGGIRDHGRE